MCKISSEIHLICKAKQAKNIFAYKAQKLIKFLTQTIFKFFNYKSFLKVL